MAIQRYLATKDARTASRSYKISLAASCGIQLLLAVVGLMVHGLFYLFPGTDGRRYYHIPGCRYVVSPVYPDRAAGPVLPD